MTPTNDAPVTVKEALRWYAENTAGCRKIGRDGDAFRQALDADGGKRALAALASAPAGDAFADAGKPIAPAGDGVERELTPMLIASARGHLANVKAHGNAEANACIVFEAVLDAAAALARPRAAVGEQSRVVWFRVCPSTGDFTGEYCTEKPDDLTGMVPMVRLALQSPPAKVEE